MMGGITDCRLEKETTHPKAEPLNRLRLPIAALFGFVRRK